MGDLVGLANDFDRIFNGFKPIYHFPRPKDCPRMAKGWRRHERKRKANLPQPSHTWRDYGNGTADTMDAR